ncbi:MAG: SH3 domain-containing protein [Hyphomicrobiaceae bacterium]
MLRLLVALVLAGLPGLVCGPSAVLAQSAEPAVKTLEQPRFLSLKSDRVNVRRGPGLQYPIAWVFRRIGMPVEVIREFDNWRQIRDSDGALGWVYRGLLAGRRTALVLPWLAKASKEEATAIRASASDRGGVVALAEPGTIANVRECDGQWCRIIIEPYEGWVEQTKLWGVYERERIKP